MLDASLARSDARPPRRRLLPSRSPGPQTREEDLRSFRVPDAVSEAFVVCFQTLPGVGDFAPNLPGQEA